MERVFAILIINLQHKVSKEAVEKALHKNFSNKAQQKAKQETFSKKTQQQKAIGTVAAQSKAKARPKAKIKHDGES